MRWAHISSTMGTWALSCGFLLGILAASAIADGDRDKSESKSRAPRETHQSYDADDDVKDRHHDRMEHQTRRHHQNERGDRGYGDEDSHRQDHYGDGDRSHHGRSHSEWIERRFDRIDSSGDGQISWQEFQRAVIHRQHIRRRHAAWGDRAHRHWMMGPPRRHHAHFHRGKWGASRFRDGHRGHSFGGRDDADHRSHNGSAKARSDHGEMEHADHEDRRDRDDANHHDRRAHGDPEDHDHRSKDDREHHHHGGRD